MVEKLAFELLVPERSLASLEADMVVAPGVEGEFGVLPMHAPLVALLRPGVIRVYEGDTVTRRVFVASGFAEVSERGFSILAEEAEPVEEIDLEEARQRLRDAEEDLADAKEASEAERQRLEQAVAVARARIEAVEHPI